MTETPIATRLARARLIAIIAAPSVPSSGRDHTYAAKEPRAIPATAHTAAATTSPRRHRPVSGSFPLSSTRASSQCRQETWTNARSCRCWRSVGSRGCRSQALATTGQPLSGVERLSQSRRGHWVETRSFDKESAVTEGIVRWFDADRGFGFIALGQDAEDLYVHASEIVSDDAMMLLREGQVVEFEIGEGDRGLQARRVRVTAAQGADTPLGVLGTVAWYEPAKGYGFITPDGGGPEIFVHSSAIVGGGVVSEGQRVAFLVVDGEKGPQADHLLPLGAQAVGRPRASDGADGTVSWYDGEKGFGFVTPDSGAEDLFVHVRALPGGVTELHEGDRVTYDVGTSEKGLQARNIRLVGGSAHRGAPAAPGRGPSARTTTPADPVRGGEGVVARYDAE